MEKVMSSNRMETIPDLNLPYMVCQFNTHETEVPAEDVLIGFTAPIRGDGAIVPADTEKLSFENHGHQVEVPAQDAFIGFTVPISRDLDHASGVADVAGSFVLADTEKLLFKKHKPQLEVPSQDACIGFTAPISRDGTTTVDHVNGVADVAGAIVPADTEKLLFKKHKQQVEVPAQDPVSRDVDHAKGVADVAGAIVPADTEKLLFKKHKQQVEVPAQDACIGFTTPISRDVDHANGVLDVCGAIVPADTETFPADTEKLLFEKQWRQADLPAQDASTGFTAPISRDVNHANGVADVAGAIVPANTGKLLSRKRRHHVEVPAQDACIGFTAPISRDVDHANGVAYVSGAIVPADTEKLLFEKQRRQVDLPAQDVSTGFTAPVSRDVNHANGVADVTGAIVPASTEKLLSRKRWHRVEKPAQNACIGFTAPISRDVDHANGAAEVAGASVDTEKLLFEKHRHLWEVAESFEACRKMPQDPHFLPLKSCKEVLREGQALGNMVTFDNIAKKTLNFHLDTKREAIKDNLSLLQELETHGFEVEILKDRLNRILLLKNEEEKVKNMSEQRKRVLPGHVQENYKFKEIRAKAEERVKELQKEVELIFKLEKNIGAKKASLQQAERDNDEKRRGIDMQIEELIASPLH